MWVIFRRWRIRLMSAQSTATNVLSPFMEVGYAICTAVLVPFAVAIALTTSGLSLVNPVMTLAAEDNKPAKKKKPDTSAKPGKPKSTTPKSGPTTKAPSKDGAIRASGADAVDKAQACYGDAPKIESISPDEGTAGAKVMITGKKLWRTGMSPVSVIWTGPRCDV